MVTATALARMRVGKISDIFTGLGTGLDLLDDIEGTIRDAHKKKTPRNLHRWVREWLAPKRGKRPKGLEHVLNEVERLELEDLEPQLALEYLLSTGFLDWRDREMPRPPRFATKPVHFVRADSFVHRPEGLTSYDCDADVEAEAEKKVEWLVVEGRNGKRSSKRGR